MAGTAFEDDEVCELLADFTPVMVNVDAEQDVGMKYGLRILPTVIFTDYDGKELARIEGAHDANEFLPVAEELTMEVLEYLASLESGEDSDDEPAVVPDAADEGEQAPIEAPSTDERR